MILSELGRKFLERHEGLRLEAYPDSRGIWTIGYGHTSMAGVPEVHKGLKITLQQSDEIFQRDLLVYAKTVDDAITYELTQFEFDALCSLCYNIGPGAFRGSHLLKYINSNDEMEHDQVRSGFLAWAHPAVLRSRREAEFLVFWNGDYSK